MTRKIETMKRGNRAPLVALLVSGVAAAGVAQAQSYPSKPIRMIQTLGTGGGADPLARLIAQRLNETLGQPLVVEAQGGAGGSIGVSMTTRAAPDGYTIMLGSVSALVLRGLLTKNTPYQAPRDFSPIILLGETVSCVVANPGVGLNTLPEAIDYAKRNPGKLAYGSSGIGTTHHLSGVMVEQLAGVQMLHVPYKAGGVAFSDLLAGQIQMLYGIVGTFAPQLKAGKVRMLAINAGKRFSRMPDVPTIGEVVPGYDRPPSWNGFLGPAGMPQPIVQRLYQEMNRAATQPEVIEKLLDLGFVVDTANPEEFTSYIRRSNELFGKLVRAAKIDPE
ncbi:MAG: tripartite tricarboxylate transporter substrate binding protein [Betaproteobacteria bacterium]|nr:tripartite tricarboxylate transporter substrate binding protein [Betaproteobacteria bacterium]